MVFAFNEIANYAGRPVYCFDFTRDSVVWRYAATDRNITLDGDVYESAPIRAGAIRQTGEPQTDEFTIEVPASLDFVAAYTELPPTERVPARVIRHHLGDTDYRVRWSGFVSRVKRVNKAKAEIICYNLTGTLRRAGLRLPWQRQCPHTIYDPSCGVSKASKAVSGTVSSKNGLALVSDGMAAAGEGKLKGGYIEWMTTRGFRARRVVMAHGTNYIELLGGTSGIDVGMTIMGYPGCQNTAEWCDSEYNNLANFGGFRHMPSKSPYDGNPVF